MGRKLFVSNLDFEIQQPQLQELFTEVGASASGFIGESEHQHGSGRSFTWDSSNGGMQSDG